FQGSFQTPPGEQFQTHAGTSFSGSSFGGGFGPTEGLGGFDPFEGRAERRVPIKGVRKVTADNMVRSVSTKVHVTEWITIDVTGTMEFVETLKGRREFTGLRVSPLLVYAKAICLALQRNPDLNTSWDEETQEIVYHRDVNLGIAAATPRGLMVPNIKGAHRLSLLQLCQAVNQLVQVSREGKLQPSDYSHGTFTITNVGVFGIDAGTPIINGDESAIFCMGSIDRRPWVVGTGADERVEPRWVTTLAVAFDHRIIDGEQGSRFLHDVASILAEPALALLY
ncbi:MAG: dihydrolipoamide acetyltransferase family protein, partial [Propionibacteriaceae bacterium]|nr:dihydrolipoamide acetyltransferase family protein [Propionibacteriaceae bacterium]